MEASWSVLAASWAVLGSSWASWSVLSASRGPLGAFLRPLLGRRSSPGPRATHPGNPGESWGIPGNPGESRGIPGSPRKSPGILVKMGVWPFKIKPTLQPLCLSGLHEPWDTPLRAQGTVADSCWQRECASVWGPFFAHSELEVLGKEEGGAKERQPDRTRTGSAA